MRRHERPRHLEITLVYLKALDRICNVVKGRRGRRRTQMPKKIIKLSLQHPNEALMRSAKVRRWLKQCEDEVNKPEVIKQIIDRFMGKC